MRWIAHPESELLERCGDEANVIGFGQPFPQRPSVPVAFALGIGVWAGCAAALSALQNVAVASCGWLALLFAALAFAALALWWRFRTHALVWVFAVGLCLGAAVGSSHAATLHLDQQRALQLEGKLRVEVIADGSTSSFGATCLARVTDAQGSTVVARVSLPQGANAPSYGSLYEGYGAISAPSETQAAYCWQKGAVATVKLRVCAQLARNDTLGLLVDIREKAIDLLTNPLRGDAGLAAAVVCGWRGSLPEEVYQDFQVSGLAHIVAVSGAHLSIVVAFVASLMRLARLPRWLSVAVQIGLVLAYLVVTAVPVSAIRAAVMTCAGLLSWTARRRASSLAALSLCIAGMVALDPQVAISASFALSALSTLGIVLFGSLLDAWIERAAPRIPAFVREALSLTCASSLLATPISASLFSQLPLASPLANVATGPLFGPVCTVGLICALLGIAIPPCASVLAAVACTASSALRAVVHAMACVPYASVPVTLPFSAALALAAASAIAAWLWWPTPASWRKQCRTPVHTGAVACAIALVAVALFVPRGTAPELVALDVGQGDAILLRSGGKTLLVDTGNQDGMLREALARQRIAHLDAVVITHPDDDHMGSLSSLRGVVKVDRVLVADDALTCPCASCATLRSNATQVAGEGRIEGLQVHDTIALGAFRLTCVWPKQFEDEGGNADSVCLLADADCNADGAPEWRSLLVGDAEHDQLQALLDSSEVGKVDVYKVGHHGSKNAITDEQAQALSPSLSLVSVGAHNRYGHPAANTTDALAAAGSEILRTDEHGDVVCKFTEERIDVSCLR